MYLVYNPVCVRGVSLPMPILFFQLSASASLTLHLDWESWLWQDETWAFWDYCNHNLSQRIVVDFRAALIVFGVQVCLPLWFRLTKSKIYMSHQNSVMPPRVPVDKGMLVKGEDYKNHLNIRE